MANNQKKNGKGWFGDSELHSRVGQQGGETTKKRHGQRFYSEIGRKGGRASSGKFESGSLRAKLAGRKGGKARAYKSSTSYGEY